MLRHAQRGGSLARDWKLNLAKEQVRRFEVRSTLPVQRSLAATRLRSNGFTIFPGAAKRYVILHALTDTGQMARHRDAVIREFATGSIDGYLVKELSCDRLAGALRLTALGEKVLPSQIAASLGRAPAISRCWDGATNGSNLTTREVDILRCLVEGEANKVISRRLSIADATVKVHIKAILRKLRVRNRTQAAIWAVGRGLAGEAPPQPISLALGQLPQKLLGETSLQAVPATQFAM